MNYATTAHKMRRKLLGLAVLEITTNTHVIRIEAVEDAIDKATNSGILMYGFCDLDLYVHNEFFKGECRKLSLRRHSPGSTDSTSHQFIKRP